VSLVEGYLQEPDLPPLAALNRGADFRLRLRHIPAPRRLKSAPLFQTFNVTISDWPPTETKTED